ncbi:MAG: DegT/DnrJ/EryC1/StrS family aminotransferase [Nanoarchaeota archaeon]|nr:DegT/DnrJ/EryC1/StrS family aminotransferase [Nanoarchaeota archaeon]
MTFIPEKQIGTGDIVLSVHEKKYLHKVIETSRMSYGPMTKEFESRFRKHHKCDHALFCNSGTSALHMSLAVLKEKYNWKDGEEIIIPALTFIATCNVVLHTNLKPVFVDIEPDTYNIDPKKIEEKITDKTRCIIPVHLFGQPADMEPIMDLAKKHNLQVIEDSCEAMFVKYKGKSIGSFGNISCFSTYIAHFLVTGVGGICLTNDDELAIMLRSYMNHGRDSIYLDMDADKGKKGSELASIVSKRFNFVRLGHSFRATEFEAAVGLGQLDIVDEIITKRKANAAFFTKGLQPLTNYLQLPTQKEDRDHGFMMYPIVIKKESPKTKEQLVNFLEENKIETRDMVPLLNQPFIKDLFGDIEKDFPVAENVRKNGFYFGCHHYLKEEEKQYIVDKVLEFFSE